MKKSDYFIKSLINAAGVFVYVSAVSWLLFNGETFVGKSISFLMPLFMLLLFVISAAITGLLVLGKPIILFLNGKKREAFIILLSTLLWLLFFLLGVAAVLVVR